MKYYRDDIYLKPGQIMDSGRYKMVVYYQVIYKDNLNRALVPTIYSLAQPTKTEVNLSHFPPFERHLQTEAYCQAIAIVQQL